MGIFYIDTEYTNGNFYLGDIFEIACLSDNSGQLYHSYINVGYKLPRYAKTLCHTTDETIRSSPPFHVVMNNLLEFIKTEQRDSPVKIIAHGGQYTDYPLIIANCQKNNYDYSKLNKYEFIDSIKELQQLGYTKPGLDSFASNRKHSAYDDVKILRKISNELLIPQELHGYTLENIEHYMHSKMPVSITDLKQAKTFQYIKELIHKLSAEKTALNRKQLGKIARYYYSRK